MYVTNNNLAAASGITSAIVAHGAVQGREANAVEASSEMACRRVGRGAGHWLFARC